GASRSVPAQHDLLAGLQFPTRSEVVALPVEISGEDTKRLFFFDTGTSGNVLHSSLRQFVKGEPVRRVRIEGTRRQIAIYKYDGISVGDLRASQDGQVVFADLAEFRQALGLEIHGIIGLSFCRNRLIDLDFDNGVLQIWSRDKSREGLGEELRLDADSSMAVIEDVRIGGSKFRCLIDTGFNGSVLVPRPTFDMLVRSGQVAVLGQQVSTEINGRSQVRFGALKSLRIGTAEIVGLSIGESTNDQMPKMGLGVLRRYVLTLDLDGKVVYFRKGKYFASRDRFDRSGISVDMVSGWPQVMSVAPGSPAADIGICVGDRIESINGVDHGRLSIYTLRELLSSGDGRVVTVKLRSDNQDTRTVALKLRNRPYER
ncbi:MAG: aspartyl protease family protein, partial [Pirellulaceae bacterium]|nr:aspartyl protease family protein [Pirellulaceae bacterium]